MARVSTARTREARRAEIARMAASPNYRLRWGRIAASVLALGSLIGWALIMAHMAGEFLDRL